jgi:hypothetical protein
VFAAKNNHLLVEKLVCQNRKHRTATRKSLANQENKSKILKQKIMSGWGIGNFSATAIFVFSASFDPAG